MTYKEAIEDQKRLVKMRARSFKNNRKEEPKSVVAKSKSDFFPKFVNKDVNSSKF